MTHRVYCNEVAAASLARGETTQIPEVQSARADESEVHRE
jgi:hypothetical protein